MVDYLALKDGLSLRLSGDNATHWMGFIAHSFILHLVPTRVKWIPPFVKKQSNFWPNLAYVKNVLIHARRKIWKTRIKKN